MYKHAIIFGNTNLRYIYYDETIFSKACEHILENGVLTTRSLKIGAVLNYGELDFLSCYI